MHCSMTFGVFSVVARPKPQLRQIFWSLGTAIMLVSLRRSLSCLRISSFPLLSSASRLSAPSRSYSRLSRRSFASAMKLAPNPFIPNVLRSLLVSTEPGCREIAVEVLG